MTQKIKVGFLVSYDWEFLRYSLGLIYPFADRIWLSLDRQGRTWGGNHFAFDRLSFHRFIDQTDSQKKVAFHVGDFYDSRRGAMENETRQRNLLAACMGQDGWHLQVDADEYIVDFESFRNYLRKIPVRRNQPVTIFANWIPIIKQIPEGFFLVHSPKGNYETFPLAFHRPCFQNARRTGYQHRLSACLVFHQTLARTSEEVKMKILNWGHAADFDAARYYERWESLTVKNYKEYKNFHPVYPHLWPELELIPAGSIWELMSTYRPQRVSVLNRLKVRVVSALLGGRA